MNPGEPTMSELMAHPVLLRVPRPAAMSRLQVAIRLVLLIAVSVAGLSSIYWVLYLGLPALVALHLSQDGGERYLTQDGPRIVRLLRWVAAAYAYLWLLTDAVPTGQGGSVELEVNVGGTPTPKSALLRLLYSIPAVVVLCLLWLIGFVFWIVGAVAVLVSGRVPAAVHDFLEMLLRFQMRLFAYHLSLVESYPALADRPLQTTAPSR